MSRFAPVRSARAADGMDIPQGSLTSHHQLPVYLACRAQSHACVVTFQGALRRY